MVHLVELNSQEQRTATRVFSFKNNRGTNLALWQPDISPPGSRMNLKFDVTKADVLAFSQQYYRSSPAHIKSRQSSRIVLPLLLTPVMLLFIYNFGLSLTSAIIFLVPMIAWYMLYPQRFDKRVGKYVEKQMQESGYANLFGTYEVSFDDEYLISIGPTGESKYRWNAVNRAELSDEHLFIFLSGPQGLPIPVNQIGIDAAHQACDLVTRKVKTAEQQVNG